VAVFLDLTEERAVRPEALPRAVRRRSPRIALVVVLLVAVAALVFLLGNERQATTQFEQAHDALVQTKSRIAATEVQLTAVREDLQFLKVQINTSETALSSDSALLQSVRTALVQAQKDAADKSSYIANLKTCQGGVQQALNALSVGDEKHAVSALNGVSTACQSAAASGG
jgi:septal ring factor EnvC (AmiA/AmiB activator)